MSMSKKHYEMIATTLKTRRKWAEGNLYREGAIDLIANDLAKQFGTDNPNFDAARFLAACGVPKHYQKVTGMTTRRTSADGTRSITVNR